jgi:hypothetical protein
VWVGIRQLRESVLEPLGFAARYERRGGERLLPDGPAILDVDALDGEREPQAAGTPAPRLAVNLLAQLRLLYRADRPPVGARKLIPSAAN